MLAGNLVTYQVDVIIPIEDLITVKLHFNSVISDPTARYMFIDVKSFYLNITLE